MSRRTKGFPKESHRSNQALSPVRLPRSMEVVESDDDEISEWFSVGTVVETQRKHNLIYVNVWRFVKFLI
jgi:hypothetical protein